MKNSTGRDLQCGFLHVSSMTTVYLCNTYRLPSGGGWEEVLRSLPKQNFESVNEMLDAGWRVD
jgi:hypothetical protein